MSLNSVLAHLSAVVAATKPKTLTAQEQAARARVVDALGDLNARLSAAETLRKDVAKLDAKVDGLIDRLLKQIKLKTLPAKSYWKGKTGGYLVVHTPKNWVVSKTKPANYTQRAESPFVQVIIDADTKAQTLWKQFERIDPTAKLIALLVTHFGGSKFAPGIYTGKKFTMSLKIKPTKSMGLDALPRFKVGVQPVRLSADEKALQKLTAEISTGKAQVEQVKKLQHGRTVALLKALLEANKDAPVIHGRHWSYDVASRKLVKNKKEYRRIDKRVDELADLTQGNQSERVTNMERLLQIKEEKKALLEKKLATKAKL